MNAFDPNDLPTQVRFVKRSLHGMMNGPVSASMREKGLTYKVNFGVELPRLREFATSLPHTYELASALWKEDIRECRILAGLLMPAEKFESLYQMDKGCVFSFYSCLTILFSGRAESPK